MSARARARARAGLGLGLEPGLGLGLGVGLGLGLGLGGASVTIWLLGPSCLRGRLYGLRASSGTERDAVMLCNIWCLRQERVGR